MLKYILKRILSSIVVLIGVVTITFFIARVIPSNPEVKWAGQRATAEQLEAARIELGLDKSLPEQYVIYLGDLLHGNLGKSLRTHQPVAAELKRYIPATLELVLLAFLLGVFNTASAGPDEKTALEHGLKELHAALEEQVVRLSRNDAHAGILQAPHEDRPLFGNVGTRALDPLWLAQRCNACNLRRRRHRPRLAHRMQSLHERLIRADTVSQAQSRHGVHLRERTHHHHVRVLRAQLHCRGLVGEIQKALVKHDQRARCCSGIEDAHEQLPFDSEPRRVVRGAEKDDCSAFLTESGSGRRCGRP